MKSVSIHTLRAAAARWLTDTAGCALVTFEQGLEGDNRRPDLLGVTGDGRTIEIEIKRTLADYKTNVRKYGTGERTASPFAPWRYYFLLGPDILGDLLLPTDGAGVLALSSHVNAQGRRTVSEVHPATDNPTAKTLTTVEMLLFASRQTARFCSLLTRVSELEKR